MFYVIVLLIALVIVDVWQTGKILNMEKSIWTLEKQLELVRTRQDRTDISLSASVVSIGKRVDELENWKAAEYERLKTLQEDAFERDKKVAEGIANILNYGVSNE